MHALNVTPEEEFAKLCEFLEIQLPKLFLVQPAYPDGFGVGSEFDDDDLIASFLMPYDAYQPAIGEAIVSLLNDLQHPWRVCGSFDLCAPFTSAGALKSAPRFWVTRSGITGDINPLRLLAVYGPNLRKANGTPAVS